MTKFLRMSEKIYKKFKEEKLFTNEPLECLNNLLKEIRQELKGTEIKMLYNFIDLNEGFKNKIADDGINLDISLIPHYKNEGEYILWLAGFIEKVTVGGKKKIPPICKNIPPSFTGLKSFEVLRERPTDQNRDEIISYFQSDEYQKTIKSYS